MGGRIDARDEAGDEWIRRGTGRAGYGGYIRSPACGVGEGVVWADSKRVPDAESGPCWSFDKKRCARDAPSDD